MVELFELACRFGLEGIESKQRDSVYRPGRSRAQPLEFLTAHAPWLGRWYFPDAQTMDPAHPDFVTRTSQPVTVSVRNSARPAAPVPLYVVPSFGWTTDTKGQWSVSRRAGGGLRVYLDRPWFSSGEGELLAAVL